MYTDFAENQIIDHLFRGQALTLPASWHIGLMKAAPGETGDGISEVSGGDYARVEVPRSLADWAGTQGDGSTVASTGDSAGTSNNNAITFPVPTADWAAGTEQVIHVAMFDAATGGDMWFYIPLTNPKTINGGDAAPKFNPATLRLTIDNG